MVKVVRVWDTTGDPGPDGWKPGGEPRFFDQPAITAEETVKNGRGRYALREPAGWPPQWQPPKSAAPASGRAGDANSAFASTAAAAPLSSVAADTTLVPARPGSDPSLGNDRDPRPGDTVADVVAQNDAARAAAQRAAGEGDADRDGDDEDPFAQIPGIGPKIARKLRFAGITTLEQLAGSTPTKLSTIAATPGKSAQVIFEQDWTGRARALVENREYTGPVVETGTKAETADVARGAAGDGQAEDRTTE